MTLTLRQAVRASEHRLPQASYRDGGQQTFWHVGYNDADEEDDGLKPGVLKDQRKDEERHAQEHGHTGDDVDKMLNFRSNGSLAPFQPRSERGDSAHHGAIPRVHDNATCSTLKGGGRGIVLNFTNEAAESAQLPGRVLKKETETHVFKGQLLGGTRHLF